MHYFDYAAFPGKHKTLWQCCGKAATSYNQYTTLMPQIQNYKVESKLSEHGIVSLIRVSCMLTHVILTT